MTIAEQIQEYVASGGDPVALQNISYYEARADKLYWCRLCGAPEVAQYRPETAQRMRAEGLCFTCDLWEQRVQGDTSKWILVGHTLYTDCGRSNEPSYLLGHAGREFRIRNLATDEILSTNNLWCGGTLPKRYHERFPDTHCFVL